MGNINVRVPDRLLQDFDNCLVNSRYKNRSDAVRDFMRRFVEGRLIQVATRYVRTEIE